MHGSSPRRDPRPVALAIKVHGIPYVPLDSWIYPALERLAATGYINSGIMGMRPWTRLECARQLSEASDRITDDDSNTEFAGIYQDLMQEFRNEVDWLGGGKQRRVAY